MTDLETAIIDARRRRAQGMQETPMPQGRMAGRIYVAANPLEYLAAGLKQYAGRKDEQSANEELKQLQQQRQQQTTKALEEFGRLAQGTPEQRSEFVAPAFDEADAKMMRGQGLQTVTPGQAPDLRAAYAALLKSPQTQQAGIQGMMQLPQMEAQKAEREAQREFQRQQAAQQAAVRMEQMQQAHQLRMDAMAAQNASREQMAEAQRQFQKEMLQMRKEMGGANAQPYFQPVQTAQGVMAFNARTGRVEPVMGPNGQPVIGAAADPTLQGNLAGAKAGATTEAKALTERRLEAPQAIAQGEETIKLVDDLLKSPGFKQAVGASRMLGVQNIPGTAAKDFDVRLDQLKGKQFLQAFESLKGGGQITEVEGKKATDAIARMNASSSEKEFENAAKEFQSVIRQGVERARKAQGGAAPQAPKPRLRFDAQGNIIQ